MLVLLNDVITILRKLCLIFLIKAVLLESKACENTAVDLESCEENHEHKADREDPTVEALTQEGYVLDSSHNLIDSCLINAS